MPQTFATSNVGMGDVAARAGVSITTVSHVVNQTRPVADSTRDRVLRVIAELGYYRNTSARLLVRGQSDSIGLIISDVENPFFPEVVKSFEAAAQAKNLQVLVCATNYDRAYAQQAVKRMLESRVRAVAVVTSQFSDDFLRQLLDRGIPLVRMHTEPGRKARSSIAIDYVPGAREAVAHLQSLGHRKIAILTGPGNRVSASEYREVLQMSLREVGLEPFRMLEAQNRPEDGFIAMRQLFKTSDVPTALVCGNDLMAMGALSGAWHLGVRVPEQLSVIGADDILLARYTNPPLTTVHVPRDELGRLCFEVLDGMLSTKRRMGVHRTVETKLVIRESTGAAPKQPR